MGSSVLAFWAPTYVDLGQFNEEKKQLSEAFDTDTLPGRGRSYGFLVAYRRWAIHECYCPRERDMIPVLVGITADYIWPADKPAVATLEDLKNGVGLFAFKEHWGMQEVGGVIVGAVALWGQIHQHEKGYRAQYAYPLAIRVEGGNMDLEGKINALYGLRHTLEDYIK